MWRIRTDDTSLKSIDGICHSKLLYCNLKDKHSNHLHFCTFRDLLVCRGMRLSLAFGPQKTMHTLATFATPLVPSRIALPAMSYGERARALAA